MDLKYPEQVFEDIVRNEAIKEELDQGGLISLQDLDRAVADARASNEFPGALADLADAVMDGDLEALNHMIARAKMNAGTVLATLSELILAARLYRDSLGARIRRIRSRIRQLSERVDAITMKASASSGHLYTYYETFLTTDGTDTARTTAIVDTTAQTVSCPKTSQRRVVLKDQDIARTSAVPYHGDKLLTYGFVNNRTIASALLDDGGMVYQIVGREQIKAGVELMVQFASPVEVNEVHLTASRNATASPQMANILTSVDGISYTLALSSPQAVGDKLVVTFPTQTIRYMKVVLKKQAPDTTVNGLPAYYFALDGIFLFRGTATTKGTFVSAPITLPDNTPFDVATLNVCDSIPDGTAIRYYMGASADSVTEIAPANSQGAVEGLPFLYLSNGTELVSKALQVDPNAKQIFLFSSPSDTFLQDPEIDNIMWDTVRLYKNAVTPDMDTAVTTQTMDNGLLRGWKAEPGGKASTIFEVDAISITLHFGTLRTRPNGSADPISAMVDGVLVTDAITLTRGIHRVVVDASDHVLVHNHILPKVAFMAEAELRRVPPTGFDTMASDAPVWALMPVTAFGEQKNRIMVKVPADPSLYIVLRGRKAISDTNQVVVVAELIPAKSGESPTLHGFSVKFDVEASSIGDNS